MRQLLSVVFLCLAPFVFAEQKGHHADPTTSAGRTGPVGLELSLYKSRILAGESLFAKVALKNFSTKPMLVTEWIFRGSSDIGAEWHKNSNYKIETYVEILDSNGGPVKLRLYGQPRHFNPFEMAISTPDLETSKFLDSLKVQGLDEKEIDARFRKFVKEREAAARGKRYPTISLAAGAKVETASWCDALVPASKPSDIACPGRGYVELPFFALDRPGRYRIRVVRDFRLSNDLKEYSDEWCVKTATAWIPFEVSK